MAAPNLMGLPPEQTTRLSELRHLLRDAPESVSARGLFSLFRKATFHVVRPDELEEAQAGYSFNPDTADDLTIGDGGWRRSWVAIGWDEDLGDPLFVDLADPELPVFTSAHGTGEWERQRVARSAGRLLRPRH